MSNARKSSRRRVLKGAVAAFNNLGSSIQCTVRDLSESGCRIVADGAVNIPDTFELRIELDGMTAQCTVQWRRKNELGVKFNAPPQVGTPKRQQIVEANVPQKAPSLRRKAVTN